MVRLPRRVMLETAKDAAEEVIGSLSKGCESRVGMGDKEWDTHSVVRKGSEHDVQREGTNTGDEPSTAAMTTRNSAVSVAFVKLQNKSAAVG